MSMYLNHFNENIFPSDNMTYLDPPTTSQRTAKLSNIIKRFFFNLKNIFIYHHKI